jgi:hypothetical protein
MRNDDEQLRHFTPLLRRIVVIVALLTAAPVVLWSITAFVRSYVGPPQIPSFRRLAAPLVQPPDNAGGGQENGDRNGDRSANPDGDRSGDQPPAAAQAPGDSTSPAPTVEARATTSDARGAPAAADGPANPANVTTMIPSVVTDADAKPTDRFTDRIPPDGAIPTGALASNQPAATDASATDAMPAAEPLHGPIPLPRQRPRIFAMAQLTATPPGPGARPPAGVPVPRPRPGAAGPPATAAEPAAHGPLDFIQGLFGQQ